MSEISAATTRAFDARVEFLSGGEPFAVETFRIDVPDGRDPLILADDRAEQSTYWNDRVPDLSRTIDIRPVDPEEPDPPLPANGAAGTACSRSGRNGTSNDATTQDVEAQR